MKDIFEYRTFNVGHVIKHIFNSTEGTIQFTLYGNFESNWFCTNTTRQRLLILPDLTSFTEEELFQESLIWDEGDYSINFYHVLELQLLGKSTKNKFWETDYNDIR